MEASTKPRHFVPSGDPSGSRLLLLQPDAVLCHMAARGNCAAYDVLYRRHHRTVYAFVFHLLGGRSCVSDAEDIAQDVFAKAFAGIDGKRDGSFRHWILTIARNRAIDHMRMGTPRVLSLHDEAVEHDPAVAVECAASEAEDRADFAWILAAVRELPQRQREALVLRELGGLSHAEIAEQLGTTVQASKQLIKRGRAALTDSADVHGVRSRNLRRELTLAAPLVPFAATAGFGLAGAGAAGFGSSALAGKTAAAVLCMAAIGGTTAAVEQSLSPAGTRVGPGLVQASVGDSVDRQTAAPGAPPESGANEGASESEKGGESPASGDRRKPARSRKAGRDRNRHDGAATAPSIAPADSGSAAAGNGRADGAAGAPVAGYGPAAKDAAPGRAGRETGGAAAPE
ncbi:MAG: sigma-70 family RNA polymerase sigma factor [Actinobacteria bacterium]|nr:sigma-70 family RNA polymerase sigma factor [Actinomycetota bacterium]